MRTRSPLLLLVAVLGLLVGACAGDGALGGPTLGGTPAAVVGDEAISNADLEDEVEMWASNEPMLQAIGVQVLGSEGRRPTDLVAFVLTHRLVSEQARQMLVDAREAVEADELDPTELGVDPEQLMEPSDGEVDQILAQLDQQFAGPDGRSVFQGFAEDFRRRLARDLAYQERLPVVLQLAVDAPDVEVNPRYGSTQDLQGGVVQVVPPTGPQPARLEA